MVLKQSHSKRFVLSPLGITCLIVLLDQLTKLWILHHVPLADTLTVSGWLNLRLTFNQGIAYGWFTQSGRLGQIILSAIACCIVLVAISYWKKYGQNIGYTITTALISGGALGNVIDRVRYSMVVDFIDVHWHGWHFATFNVADIAVSCGAGLFAICLLRKQPAETQHH